LGYGVPAPVGCHPPATGTTSGAAAQGAHTAPSRRLRGARAGLPDRWSHPPGTGAGTAEPHRPGRAQGLAAHTLFRARLAHTPIEDGGRAAWGGGPAAAVRGDQRLSSGTGGRPTLLATTADGGRAHLRVAAAVSASQDGAGGCLGQSGLDQLRPQDPALEP